MVERCEYCEEIYELRELTQVHLGNRLILICKDCQNSFLDQLGY